jgi:4-alpha-glucanotransferase
LQRYSNFLLRRQMSLLGYNHRLMNALDEKFPRSSGILLHPTSLPGPYGVGDIGPEAYRFVDFLAAAGQKLWQVLPLNPTGYADSPFQALSAHAGNPLLISLDRLVDTGVLTRKDVANPPLFPEDRVEFGEAIHFKLPLLRKAAQNFFRSTSAPERNRYNAFVHENRDWLKDFALFMAVKEAHDLVAWNKWPANIALRKPDAMKCWSEKLASSIEVIQYWQYVFFQQWHDLRQYAHERGIRIIGDVPIYVAHDSSDVWAKPEFFLLDAHGNPAKMSGVPPDYFSATGQLWGNPIYNWPLMKRTTYAWWVDRIRAALRLYDYIRLDHFRGFEAYWQVPGGETTALNGEWVKGPGGELFAVLQRELGDLPIIAENLGVITPEVEAIRHEFNMPGMAILQFGFGHDPQAPTFRPHNYVHELVAYTGTHDNDTVVGWWNSKPGSDSIRTQEDIEKEHVFAKKYLHFDDEPIHWVMIRAVMASVANTAIVPLQDVLGLGSQARMNLPGSPSGHWNWRARTGAVTTEHAERLRQFVALYER